MSIDLSSAASRDALAPRRHEYFQKAGAGFLGFYRSPAGKGKDTWSGRWRDPTTGKQHTERFDAVSKLPPGKQYRAASDELTTWVARMEELARRSIALGVPLGVGVPETVADALLAYQATVKDKGLPQRLAVLVLGGGKKNHPVDPLAAVKLTDPTLKYELTAWRERMAQGRGTTTCNRDLVPIRAALKMAAEFVTAARWTEALKPGDPAKHELGEALGVYRSTDERREVLDNMEPRVRLFFRTQALLPVRPGMLADLNIGHWNKAARQITVGYDKKHPRTIALSEKVAELFIEAIGKRKDPDEPVFLTPRGYRWNGRIWDEAIKFAAAIALAKRGQEWDHSAVWSAYDFRHSTITDLIEAGISVTTVAKIAGTSPEMIYRRYHNLLDRHAVHALEVLDTVF
jgi:integrase